MSYFSTSLRNALTYFSPAPVVPLWTGSCVTMLCLRGFGGHITVMGTLSVFILADHNPTLNAASTAAGALTRQNTTTDPHHEVTWWKKLQFDSNSNSPRKNSLCWNHNLNWENTSEHLNFRRGCIRVCWWKGDCVFVFVFYYSWLFNFHIHFRNNLSVSVPHKESKFDWYFMESICQFGENLHLYNAESSNSWKRDILKKLAIGNSPFP